MPGGKALLSVKGCRADEKSLLPMCLVMSRQMLSVLTVMELFLTSAGSSPMSVEMRLKRGRGRSTMRAHTYVENI